MKWRDLLWVRFRDQDADMETRKPTLMSRPPLDTRGVIGGIRGTGGRRRTEVLLLLFTAARSGGN